MTISNMDAAVLATYNPGGVRDLNKARQAIKRLLKTTRPAQKQALVRFLGTPGSGLGSDAPWWAYEMAGLLLGRYGYLGGQERGRKVREVLRDRLICAVGQGGRL